MDVGFSKESELKLQDLLDTCPDKETCLLPALHIAQAQFCYLTHEVMALVAARLGLPPEAVLSAATFHTLFNKRPVGRYHIQVCCNVSCFLNGSDALLRFLEQELNIGPGETTEDGLFTLSTVQCLALCGTAPAVQVNETCHENMTVEKAGQLLLRLREGRE